MGQRGFTLLEMLVAAAITVVTAFFCLQFATAALHTLLLTQTRFTQAAAIDALADRWQAEEDSAWAIFTPPNDVNGNANADGHELDFFTRDAKQRNSFWAYDFDAPAKTLRKYLYAMPGGRPVLDQSYAGITSFYAHTYPLSALSDSSSKLYSPAFAGASLQDGGVQFFPSTQPWIVGGNQITYVHVETAANVREMHLSTQTAPSGYIVVLNYTPAPSPSPSPGLNIWPPAVRYASSGNQLAYDSRRAFSVAGFVNGLLGGGLAAAAGTCIARAYPSTTALTNDQPYTAGTRDPWGAGITIRTNGCFSGAVALNEPGYTQAFNDYPIVGACTNTQVQVGIWSPSQNGPTAHQAFSGARSTTTTCYLGFQDLSSTPHEVQTTAQIVDPCWEIGGTCTYDITYLNDGGASCDPTTGEVSSGYSGGFSKIAPTSAGTWADPTFTRAAPGTVTVTEYSIYETAHAIRQSAGGYRCVFSNSPSITGNFTIPSV
ncbi:MAG: type II secretion system protein J [Candidatus Baltobacteraceae bacterium]